MWKEPVWSTKRSVPREHKSRRLVILSLSMDKETEVCRLPLQAGLARLAKPVDVWFALKASQVMQCMWSLVPYFKKRCG